jgi:hypothetical protein
VSSFWRHQCGEQGIVPATAGLTLFNGAFRKANEWLFSAVQGKQTKANSGKPEFAGDLAASLLGPPLAIG